MDRRNFLTSASSAGLAGVLAHAAPAAAAQTGPLPPKNLLFSTDNTGIWESKKATHVPSIGVEDGRATIATPHPMLEEHFIVRHTLLLADGTVVGAKTFTYKDQPVSEYALPKGYKGRIIATSFCNQHDFWWAEATV